MKNKQSTRERQLTRRTDTLQVVDKIEPIQDLNTRKTYVHAGITGHIYTDQTGRFPNMSSHGMQYFLVMYYYILVLYCILVFLTFDSSITVSNHVCVVVIIRFKQ